MPLNAIFERSPDYDRISRLLEPYTSSDTNGKINHIPHQKSSELLVYSTPAQQYCSNTNYEKTKKSN